MVTSDLTQMLSVTQLNTRVSQKSYFVIFHIFTKFQNFFTGTYCAQLAIMQLLNIAPHSNCVGTLPCEKLIFKNHYTSHIRGAFKKFCKSIR